MYVPYRISSKIFMLEEGKGVMCACGARPGSEGPHVGAVPHRRWGHSNRRFLYPLPYTIFPASRQKGNIHHGHV